MKGMSVRPRCRSTALHRITSAIALRETHRICRDCAAVHTARELNEHRVFGTMPALWR